MQTHSFRHHIAQAPALSGWDWLRGLLIAIWLTQSGHKLANLPAIVCTETALSCPVEPTVSRYDRSDSNVTHQSPPLLVVCASSSSIFSSVFLVLLFQSCAISLSIRVCIPFFLARTLIFSSTLCPAKHLTFVWQCFSLEVYTSPLCPLYLCGCPLTSPLLMYVSILRRRISLRVKVAEVWRNPGTKVRFEKEQRSIVSIIRVVAD